MKLARTIRFDASDLNVFPRAAAEGEWAVVGSLVFAPVAESDLTGKVKQAFSNGFVGVESFGYSTFIAVAAAKDDTTAQIKNHLIRHFMEELGAPSHDAAASAADDEIAFMAELCANHKTGTLLTLQREMREGGIHEVFRHLPKPDSCAEQKIWTITEDAS